jgi:hypothetical protein
MVNLVIVEGKQVVAAKITRRLAVFNSITHIGGVIVKGGFLLNTFSEFRGVSTWSTILILDMMDQAAQTSEVLVACWALQVLFGSMILEQVSMLVT